MGREQEADYQQERERIDRDQALLDAGSVASARQLEDLQHEIANLARRVSDLEDAELEVMEKLEDTQARAASAATAVAELAEQRQAAERARDEAFADIDELAQGCRFGDCGHEREPGCAVLAAAEADPQVEARLASWRSLQRELAWLARRSDVRLMAEERRRWAAIGKEGKARARIDPRRR